ncbi:MAG: hypothetical protein Q7U60_11705 [Candidatus Methanoperedens sp.]|nr:hypothetical protein [Candidatus Methanoperedens sp.]
MKKLDINQLDDSDEEIAEILISSGMSRPVARTLAYLRKVDTATSIDLERGTGLRQPEVSIAMRQLDPFDWIDESEEKKPGKGRPTGCPKYNFNKSKKNQNINKKPTSLSIRFK